MKKQIVIGQRVISFDDGLPSVEELEHRKESNVKKPVTKSTKSTAPKKDTNKKFIRTADVDNFTRQSRALNELSKKEVQNLKNIRDSRPKMGYAIYSKESKEFEKFKRQFILGEYGKCAHMKKAYDEKGITFKKTEIDSLFCIACWNRKIDGCRYVIKEFPDVDVNALDHLGFHWAASSTIRSSRDEKSRFIEEILELGATPSSLNVFMVLTELLDINLSTFISVMANISEEHHPHIMRGASDIVLRRFIKLNSTGLLNDDIYKFCVTYAGYTDGEIESIKESMYNVKDPVMRRSIIESLRPEGARDSEPISFHDVASRF